MSSGVILNTAGEAGDVFSRPSYDSPGVPDRLTDRWIDRTAN